MNYKIGHSIALVSLIISPMAFAKTSDDKTFAVSTGWIHIMPQSEEQGIDNHMTVSGLGIDQEFNSSNAGFAVKDADTAGFIFDYFVNDHVALEVVAGVPPEMELAGKGQINIPLFGTEIKAADLSKFDNIATTDAYTPTFLAKYHFGKIDSKIRPYVGAGLMYGYFNDVKINPGVNAELNSNPILAALKPEIGKVKVDDAIAPVAIVGVDYNINQNWYTTASVSYAHLSTTATLDVVSQKNNETILQGKSNIEINPLVSYVGIGYRF